MIIEEYKSESTLIKFNDRDIVSKEKNKEIIDILLGIMVKKVAEYF